MRPNESFTAQPVRSLQTMLRTIAQDDPRLPTVVPDGIYGPTTTNAVAAFQRLYGIPATGVADQTTWDQIVLVYEPALVRIGKAEPIEILLEPGQIIVLGERNPHIYLTQAILSQLSNQYHLIPAVELTGILDGDTSDSLSAFQSLAGLPVTGELDRMTWKHLSNHFTLQAHNELSSKAPGHNKFQNY